MPALPASLRPDYKPLEAPLLDDASPFYVRLRHMVGGSVRA